MSRGLLWLQQRRNRSRRGFGNTAARALERFNGGLVSSDSEMGCPPDAASFDGEMGCSLTAIASVLQHCAKSKTLTVGRSCHDHLCRLAFDAHPYLQSLLVQMYACTHALNDAMAVFTATHHLHQQSFIWNHIISSLVDQQHWAYVSLVFERMWQQCVLPDKFTFTSVLSSFTSEEYAQKGKHLHAIILACGLQQNVVLATAILTMYQKCGLLEAAWNTFINILQPDEVCWTSMISAYAQHCQFEQALHLFDLMVREGFPPSNFAIVCILDACANCTAGILEGKLLHSCIMEEDIKIDTPLGNVLIKFYSACEYNNDARHVYDHMQSRNVVSSNYLIRAYAKQGQANEACQIFYQLFREGIMPNKMTYSGVVDAFGIGFLPEESELRRFHGSVVEAGFDKDILLETKLLKMYVEYGRIGDARRIFEKMQEHSSSSWTTMISGLSWQVKGTEALLLFNQMLQEGTRPSRATCFCLLDACASSFKPMNAKYGHVYILNCGLESDTVICSSIISMYGKCGSIADAWKAFQTMPQHDLVSWTAMIGVYAQHSHGKEAVQLFSKMLQDLGANKVTYICVINACTSSFMLLEGRLIYFCIIHDAFETDIEITNALVDMHGKCGSIEDAVHIFSLASTPDVFSWTALAGAYAWYGQTGEALGHFENMLLNGVVPNMVTFISMLDSFLNEKWLVLGKHMHCRIIECGLMPDVTIGNTIIKMYGRCQSLDAARKAFEDLGERNLVSWTAIIAVHAQHSKGEEALKYFSQMQVMGMQPNSITFVCLLDACASSVALATGEHIHSLIVRENLESNVFVGTALVNMYGKCGQLYSARHVFDRLASKNLLTWTAIVAIYAHHGEGKEAVKLFESMEREGFRADDATLVSILAACSHSGLVEEGSLLFTKMRQNGDISPNEDHYACMIDLLGRAGRLNEAELLLYDMPFEPSSATLTSLLGSCRQKEDLQRGQHAALSVLDLNHNESAPYVMLSNMHASIEREEDGVPIYRKDMMMWPNLPCSLHEVNEVQESFVEEDYAGCLRGDDNLSGSNFDKEYSIHHAGSIISVRAIS